MNKSKSIGLVLISALLLMAIVSGVKAQGTATVVVLDTIGGTVNPNGTNTYADGTAVTLTATPTSTAYLFARCVISLNARPTPAISTLPSTSTCWPKSPAATARAAAGRT